MQSKHYTARKPEPRACSVPITDLKGHAAGWIAAGESDQLSPATLAQRRLVTGRLLWWLTETETAEATTTSLRAFFGYLGRPGRWEGKRVLNARPMRPTSVRFYHAYLASFFAFLVAEGELEASPMERIRPPVVREDGIEPFNEEQVNAILRAARDSTYRRRDEALCFFLLDTGARAAEVCGLRVGGLDLGGRRATLLGKGNKFRTVPMGARLTRALWTYLNERERDKGSPVFLAEGGAAPLTVSGLRQIVVRLGRRAGITGVRCSPHTFRHTAAVEFLRAGGNVAALQMLLGHTTLKMSLAYARLVQADVEAVHRIASPADRMVRRK